MDAASVEAIFGRLDRELWLVTAHAGPRRGGLIATFVSQASIVTELPRVIVGLARHHHTWELVEASRAFALHLLAEEHVDWVFDFGARSGRDVDKFAGRSVQSAITGSPILTDAVAWLDCRVESRLDTGDRTVYLAEVVEARQARPVPPLTVQQFLRLAPKEKLSILKEQLTSDAAVDAAAIRAWRQRTGHPPP
jgi:flavin reductase (DIM6/NTAB) family NADH-FMN oxidoreductase RutF